MPPSRQLGLFGDSGALPPTSFEPELVRLGERVPAAVNMGTCSWTFDGWRGDVYRVPYASRKAFISESLAEYVRYPLFRTVEIDRSYYGPLSADEYARYAAPMPPGFRAATKAWQELTTIIFSDHPSHGDRRGQVNPFFLDPVRFTEQVADPVRKGLGDHAGPIILQVPPAGPRADSAAFEARLDEFLQRVPSQLRYAVELRDLHLFTRRYLAILREHGAAHVLNFWSRMPSISEQLAKGALTTDFTVARLMLPRGARYQQLRDDWAPFDRIQRVDAEMRADVLAMIREALERSVTVFVYANNKAEGSAPLTIRAIAEELT